MKRISIAVGLTLVLTFITIPQPVKADPITIVITTVVKKVLKAMDLAVQKMQTATVKLQNIQKAIENAMQKLQLQEIFDWTEKQRKLFDDYYQELWKVKSLITYYKRTRDIVDMEIQIVQEYRDAIKLFNGDYHFTPENITSMLDVYEGILIASAQNVDLITDVIASFSIQMTDGERLAKIDQTEQAVRNNLNDLRRITNQNVMYSLQKAKDKTELTTLRRYYGINDQP